MYESPISRMCSKLSHKEDNIEFLLDQLSKMSPMVVYTAYLYAINYTSYGIDVTEKWGTTTQNVSALEKAYQKGYYDALQMQAENEDENAGCN